MGCEKDIGQKTMENAGLIFDLNDIRKKHALIEDEKKHIETNSGNLIENY